MTALKKYQRLEATALWRATPQDQRREVIVSIGDASLTISDLNDRALTHWSIAAVERLNPGVRPAIFSPDGDPGETLEVGAAEDTMIVAIETLRKAVARTRPRPGRLRLVSGLASAAAVLALAVFWLPGAMMRHTVAVLPPIKKTEIAAALLGRIERLSGPVCTNRPARAALAKLAQRTGVAALVVLPDGVRATLSLPGGLVLVNRALIEDFEDPGAVAGFITAERARMDAQAPLTDLLRFGGPLASFRLITTGTLDPETLDSYAEHVLKMPRPTLPDEDLLAAFARAELPSSPYAYALDQTGETVIGLIEADPMAALPVPQILPDRDWLLLQSICEP